MPPKLNEKKRMNLLFIPAALSYLAVLMEALFEGGWLHVHLPTLLLMALFAFFFFVPFKYHSKKRWSCTLQIALETACAGGLLILHPGEGVYPILFFLISTEVSILFNLRTAFLWYGIFTVLTAVIFIDYQGLRGLISLLPYAGGYWFFGIFGWTRTMAEKERQRSEELLTELQKSHAQLQEYAARVEELAIVQERNRIAREVHDSLGHRLTVASVQLEGAQRLIHTNPVRSENIIATVRDQVREGLTELRRTVAMLRSSVEAELPLSQSLTRLTAQFEEATGLTIHLDLEECPDALPSAYTHSFYHAVQEGLTNVQRHARASEVWLNFIRRNDQITLLISDNGSGLQETIDKKDLHFGLAGLKEQAAMLGGDFHLDPRPGGGVQITFRLPEPMEVAHE
jgi:signal transduction histidine kinase